VIADIDPENVASVAVARKHRLTEGGPASDAGKLVPRHIIEQTG
jgi:hypothetical protein